MGKKTMLMQKFCADIRPASMLKRAASDTRAGSSNTEFVALENFAHRSSLQAPVDAWLLPAPTPMDGRTRRAGRVMV